MNTPRLHQVSMDQWRGGLSCGPAAISAITGCLVSEAKTILREVSGRRAIRGVNNSNMRKALRRLGYLMVSVEPRTTKEKPTLAFWLEARQGRGLRERLCLINTTGHYLTVQGDRIVDNWMKLPTPIEQFHQPRKRVRRAWKIVACDRFSWQEPPPSA